MADKRLDSMNEYEQLKRKNRRRLVGASAMVLVAGIVFGVAVNGGDEGGNAAQNISINKDGGQPEILTPKPIEPAGGKTRQDELENPLLAGGSSTQDEAANDTFEMPSEKAKEVPPVYELKEGQETVEAQGDDGNVHTVVKKAEPNNDYDRQPLPAITINNSNKQAAEKAERKAAQKAAEAKRQAEEKAREIAERKAEADRLAAEEEAAERAKREEEARLAKQKQEAEEKRLAERQAKEQKRLEAKQRAEEKRLKEERLAELKQQREERKQAEMKKAEEEKRLAEQKKRLEERKQAEAKKAEEEKRLAEQKKRDDAKKAAEEKRLAEQKKRLEERKQAEMKKAEEEKRLAEQKKRDDAKKAAEEKRLAEQKKRLEERKQAEAKKAEEEKRLAEQKKRDDAKRTAGNKAGQALENKSKPAKADPKEILNNQKGRRAMIQAGAYNSQAQAKKVQQRLADAGYSTSINEVDTAKGKVYRVRTGSFSSQEAAQNALAKIRLQGVDGVVILGK